MDWYRRKTWSLIDETEFFAKLARARKDGRAQYLKIQAIELVETKDKDLLSVAESLLLKLLQDYPEDNFNRSSALHTLGDIYKLRMEYEVAIDYYKQSLDFEQIFPNVITGSYIEFSELVIKLSKTNYYNMVEELLEPKLPKELFPVSRYKISLILAALNKYKNNNAMAQHYIKIAEENANATASALRYHKTLGLVTDRDHWLERLLGR